MSFGTLHEKGMVDEIAHGVFLAVFDVYLQLFRACPRFWLRTWLLLRRSGELCCTSERVDEFQLVDSRTNLLDVFPLSG